MELNQIIEQNVEGTSTWELAQELFRSSWVNNVGRTIHDTVLFDALDEVGKFHLLETAYATEKMLEIYDTEELTLLTWNTAETLYTVYVNHPASGDLPNLPWVSAPDDVKRLYYAMAVDVLRKWYEVKALPRHRGWIEVSIKR